tara:strand:- start:38 stop:208 length:171 start_codon:yes stop_codon:yes gene_type:complete
MVEAAALWIRGGELLQQLGVLFDHLAGEFFYFDPSIKRTRIYVPHCSLFQVDHLIK